ncbi:MAG: hypothetical protein IT287_09810, partial [Bdellovibrionaceae bacterium]|nr:hypothetical protein [Pseudobdellovibrionaceae bacterium]
MKVLSVWILTLLLGNLAQASEVSTADIYDIDGKEKLFTFSSERIYAKENMSYTAIWKDVAGTVVANEKAEFNKGVLTRYEVERPLLKEKGLIETKDGKILFTYTENGKTTTGKEALKPDTLIGATLVPHMEVHLKELLEKKEVTFKYAVWFRKEVIGFKFEYDKEEGNNIIAKMIPTNFLYRSMVKPIYFTMDKTTKKIISLKGRTLPKIQKDGSWR